MKRRLLVCVLVAACVFTGGLNTEARGISGAISVLLSYVQPPPPTNTLVCLGDSITEGLPENIGILTPWPALIQSANTNLIVWNAGLCGEWSSAGAERISGVISTYAPDIMTIEYGFNDLFIDHLEDMQARRSPNEVLSSLSYMVQVCINNGVVPIMTTLLPTGSQRINQSDLLELNSLIRSYANVNGIDWVDMYYEFVNRGGLSLLLDDSVHPNAWGMQVMAAVFNAKAIVVQHRLWDAAGVDYD